MKLLRHICEVCGRDEVLDSDAAYAAGWDYPPRMGVFGVVSPRTCGSCSIADTVWAALMMHGVSADELTPAQRAVVERIAAEPESIMVGGEAPGAGVR